MVPRGGVPRPPPNPNNGCCHSPRSLRRSTRRVAVASGSAPGRRLKRSDARAAVAAAAKRPQSADQWATLRPKQQTARTAGWTRTWGANTVPPQAGPTTRERLEAREAPGARPRSAPLGRPATGAHDRPASARDEYRQWGKQLHEKTRTHRSSSSSRNAQREPERVRQRKPERRLATKPSPPARTGAQRLGATPRVLHHSRGHGAFTLLEARKQVMHDAARRRRRQERELAAAAAEAAQKRGELERAADKASERERTQALKGTSSRVWGPESSVGTLDWQAWSLALSSRGAPSGSPSPSPRLGGERASEVGPWEAHTAVSQVKQRPRISDLESYRKPTVPMRLGAPRTLPLKKAKFLHQGAETSIEKLEPAVRCA